MKKILFYSLVGLVLFSAKAFSATLCVNTVSDEATINIADCTSACTSAGGSLCSLREAMTKANSTLAADVITFSLSGSAPHTFSPTSNLPTITAPLTVDGTSDPHYNSSNPPVIIFSGSASVRVGLIIQSSDSIVKGIQVLNFSDDGIRVVGSSSSSETQRVQIGPHNVISGNGEGIRIAENANTITIKGNYIGTNSAGTEAFPNQTGITITNSSHDNLIGGPTSSDANVISGNYQSSTSGGDGVSISVFSHHNTIQNNKIGTDVTGLHAVPNQGNGVKISHGSSNNQVGPGNIISGNTGNGIYLTPLQFTFDVTGNKIIGNFIGLSADESSDLGNGGSGILIDGTGPTPASSPNHVSQTQIGSPLVGAHISAEVNYITFNHGDGISILSSQQNSIFGNVIYSNIGLGIHLNPTSVVPGNGNQSAPQINEQRFDVDHFVITGTFTGVASRNHGIQLFSNTICSSANPQGEHIQDLNTFTTDSSGNGTFTFNVPILTGTFLTAISSDLTTQNTSAFSSCFTLPMHTEATGGSGGSESGGSGGGDAGASGTSEGTGGSPTSPSETLGASSGGCSLIIGM